MRICKVGMNELKFADENLSAFVLFCNRSIGVEEYCSNALKAAFTGSYFRLSEIAAP